MFYQLVPTKYPLLPQKNVQNDKNAFQDNFEATYDNIMNHNIAHMLKN